MNTVISGDIGAGKTYFSVKEFLLPYARENYHLYTNIPLIKRYFSAVGAVSVNVESGADIIKRCALQPDDVEGKTLNLKFPALVVLDEAQIFADSSTASRADLKPLYSCIEMSRHFNIEFVFITQNAKRFNPQIIKSCNQFIHLYNMAVVGLKTGYNAAYSLKLGAKSILDVRSSYEARYFRLYDSVASWAEIKPPKTKTAWKAVLPLVLAPVAVVVCLISVAFGFSSMGKTAGKVKAPSKSSSAVAVSSAPSLGDSLNLPLPGGSVVQDAPPPASVQFQQQLQVLNVQRSSDSFVSSSSYMGRTIPAVRNGGGCMVSGCWKRCILILAGETAVRRTREYICEGEVPNV